MNAFGRRRVRTLLLAGLSAAAMVCATSHAFAEPLPVLSPRAAAKLRRPCRREPFGRRVQRAQRSRPGAGRRLVSRARSSTPRRSKRLRHSYGIVIARTPESWPGGRGDPERARGLHPWIASLPARDDGRSARPNSSKAAWASPAGQLAARRLRSRPSGLRYRQCKARSEHRWSGSSRTTQSAILSAQATGAPRAGRSQPFTPVAPTRRFGSAKTA